MVWDVGSFKSTELMFVFVLDSLPLDSDGGVYSSVDYCGKSSSANPRVIRRVFRCEETFLSDVS